MHTDAVRVYNNNNNNEYTERLPYRNNNHILQIKGIAGEVKRDAKFLGTGVRNKGRVARSLDQKNRTKFLRTNNARKHLP